MKIPRRWLALVLVAWAAQTAAWAQSPIKVGVILPLSGGAGPQGQHVSQAIQSMATLINESGGIMGRPLEIVVRDDESTPAVGVSRANDLVAQGVSVILEGWNSPVALAMQPVIARAGVLDITLFASADAVLSGEGNPVAIRLNASNSQGGAAVARVIANTFKATRIAFLTENDAYGIGTQASIEAELKRLNYAYEKVAEEKFPFAQADFRIPLTNVRAATPDVTVAINANEGLGMPAILRQFKQGRVPGELLAALGTVAPSVISVAGEAANGVSGVDIYFPDVEPFASNPVNKKFVERTQAMFKNTPDKFMAVGAAALQLWAMSANELKTLDREALAKRIRGGSFKGTVFGDVSFAANGQLQLPAHAFKVRDGLIVVQK
ncbi:MAG: ABC transporter substrate-binding protein [Burkholderiaceae bacterium]|nr:MAG: ABC transporter substrate-binding protein [Burkholderiaceae bacterium]